MIPKDPMILLSYVNTQLRDFYDTLDELCASRGLDKSSLIKQMEGIDFHYDGVLNQFR